MKFHEFHQIFNNVLSDIISFFPAAPLPKIGFISSLNYKFIKIFLRYTFQGKSKIEFQQSTRLVKFFSIIELLVFQIYPLL